MSTIQCCCSGPTDSCNLCVTPGGICGPVSGATVEILGYSSLGSNPRLGAYIDPSANNMTYGTGTIVGTMPYCISVLPGAYLIHVTAPGYDDSNTLFLACDNCGTMLTRFPDYGYTTYSDQSITQQYKNYARLNGVMLIAGGGNPYFGSGGCGAYLDQGDGSASLIGYNAGTYYSLGCPGLTSASKIFVVSQQKTIFISDSYGQRGIDLYSRGVIDSITYDPLVITGHWEPWYACDTIASYSPCYYSDDPAYVSHVAGSYSPGGSFTIE